MLLTTFVAPRTDGLATTTSIPGHFFHHALRALLEAPQGPARPDGTFSVQRTQNTAPGEVMFCAQLPKNVTPQMSQNVTPSSGPSPGA